MLKGIGFSALVGILLNLLLPGREKAEDGAAEK